MEDLGLVDHLNQGSFHRQIDDLASSEGARMK
jgi:hypothetical protein